MAALAVLWLLLGWWCQTAPAAQVIDAKLLRQQRVTRLVLAADGPLEFQVELADPQTVLVRLPGTALKAPLPDPADDPLVASLNLRQDQGGATVVVRTRRPGVTVLPLYEATSHRLTLELGGAPTVEVKLPPEKKPQPTAQPTAKPKPKAQPKPKASTPVAKPAPAAPAGPPPLVTGVRLGTHPDYTRLVLDGDAPLEARLKTPAPRLLRLRLRRARLAPGGRIAGPDQRVLGIALRDKAPLTLEIRLARALKRHRLFGLQGGRKVVLDLWLYAPGQEPPAPKPKPQAAPQAQEKPPAAPKPAAAAQPSAPPAPAAAENEPAPAQAKTTPPPAQKPAPPAPSQPPAPEVAFSVPAQVAQGQAMARGKMPPLPPPPPLAHPRGPLPRSGAGQAAVSTAAVATTAATAAPASPREVEPQVSLARVVKGDPRLAVGAMPPPPPAGPRTQEVIAKLRQARQKPAATAAPPGAATPGVQPQLPPVRPPQAAQLGPKAREDQAARNLFDQAKEALDTRHYQEAVRLFDQFLKRFPKHELAAEATFRLADAFLNLHERNIFPVYSEVMENFQKAIDLYPDSDQVPWALLQMGRAAMLAGEPFKAVGYFELVAEDYPKSEYVPLALVSRARAFLAEGKYQRALDEFRQVAEKYPKSRYRKDADWGQAQALFAMGRYTQASLLLKDMDKRDPKLRIQEPELLYYIGEAEFQLKNYYEARRYFLWALNIKPDLPDADIILARVGDTYQFEGAYKAAREVYRQVIELFPGKDGALVAQLRLAESPQKDQQHPWDIFQVKATTDAFKAYQEIARKYPERPVAQLAQLKLGVYYYKKKDYRQAIRTLKELLQTHPRTTFRTEVSYTLNLAVGGLLGELRKQEKPLELMSTYLKYRDLLTRPNSNQMLRMLAWAYDKTGLNRRAANLYRILLERGLNDATLNLGLAKNLMAAKDYAGVVDALDEAALGGLRGEDLARALSLKGRALASLGRCQKAVAVLQKALKLAPTSPRAADDNLALGRCLSRLERYLPALEALDRAMEIFAGRADAVSRVKLFLASMEAGFIAKKTGQLPKALEYFRRALKSATSQRDQAQALYQIADNLREQGRIKQMAQEFTRLVKMRVNPWSQMAARRLQGLKLAPSLAQVGE